MEFAKRIKNVQESAREVLRKVQEKIKRQVDRERKETKEWKKENKVILSMKNLMFKEQLAKKLMDQYMFVYISSMK